MPSTITLPSLRRYRAAYGLSVAELARRARLSAATIARIERGQPARPATLAALAEALRVRPAFLVASAAPAHPAQHPSMPPHRAPALDLATIDPQRWPAWRRDLPPNVLLFASRAASIRLKRQARADALRGRSHREPWA